MGLSFIERRQRVFWDVDPKIENAIRERQNITKAFKNGYSLPRILDNSSQDPKWQEAEEGYGTFVFTEKYSGRPIRSERPCIDNSILFIDTDTKEAVAITYENSELEQSMERYWNLS